MSQVPDRKGYDRQVRYGRILGLFFCVAGFVAIGFGWNGSAKTAFVDVQFPYLVSGGIGGLALVLLGVGLLVMSQFRGERIRLGEQLQQVGAVISKAAAPPGSAGAGEVVAGKSTYHRPECRLVEGKADLDRVSVDVARLQGLSPCRVCNPPGAGEDGKKTSTRKRGRGASKEPAAEAGSTGTTEAASTEAAPSTEPVAPKE
ncbi:MAG TPA: hypothetical protein VG602_07565 [Actinomycetota bacterium]|nr:hypothetical protein [Actinomycetota bacterium]